ncbi:MAG: Maf family protein [Candidatus Adiutrix sp.]|jgi:septum formation protein|nr:Maf family protein [Candidatus Adiutrix sp.]
MTWGKLILASASPRRADLLRWAGLDFELVPANLDETRRAGETPLDYAGRLARAKSLAGAQPGRLSLGADTTVFIGNLIFEKPVHREEAASHLQSLSGRSHQVVTAFALAAGPTLLHQEAVVSRVTFRPLTRSMIDHYLATGEGLDKAGAYGLQGWGGFLVETIEGSYTNVVGLPLTEVLAALEKAGAGDSLVSPGLDLPVSP